MTVQLKGDNLVITIPATASSPEPSKSGKTLTVASSEGFQETELKVKGKSVYLNLHAYIHVKDKKNAAK